MVLTGSLCVWKIQLSHWNSKGGGWISNAIPQLCSRKREEAKCLFSRFRDNYSAQMGSEQNRNPHGGKKIIAVGEQQCWEYSINLMSDCMKMWRCGSLTASEPMFLFPSFPGFEFWGLFSFLFCSFLSFKGANSCMSSPFLGSKSGRLWLNLVEPLEPFSPSTVQGTLEVSHGVFCFACVYI